LVIQFEGLIYKTGKRSLSMSSFDTYRNSFPNAHLTRSKAGVLEVALHTNGGTLAFNGYTHEQFVGLFDAIGSDRDNRVVILTGSGNAFMETISPEGCERPDAATYRIHPARRHCAGDAFSCFSGQAAFRIGRSVW
jgi:hypothetical protein